MNPTVRFTLCPQPLKLKLSKIEKLSGGGSGGKPLAQLSLFTPPPIVGMVVEPPNDAMFATLDTLDTWADLPTWRSFITHDGYAFDVMFMIRLMTEQLNTEKSFNPYPRFPNNPFTREAFSHEDLDRLWNRICDNGLEVAAPLAEFLTNKNLWTVTVGTAGTEQDWMQLCIQSFEAKLRFVRQFSGLERNGELKLLCYWKPWTTPVAPTEAAVLRYLQTFRQAGINRLARGHHHTVLPPAYYCNYQD